MSVYIGKVQSIDPVNNTARVYLNTEQYDAETCYISAAKPYNNIYGEQYYPEGVYENNISKMSGGFPSDLIAIVAPISGHHFRYAIIGFLPPNANQLSILEYGLDIKKHESGVISLTRVNGDSVFYHPSGTYFKIGSQENDVVSSFKPRNTDTFGLPDKSKFNASNPTNLYIRHWAGQKITLDKDGGLLIDIGNGKCTLSISASGTVDLTSATAINIKTPSMNISR